MTGIVGVNEASTVGEGVTLVARTAGVSGVIAGVAGIQPAAMTARHNSVMTFRQ